MALALNSGKALLTHRTPVFCLRGAYFGPLFNALEAELVFASV